MALARQFAKPQSLSQMFGIEPEVGQEPSGIAFNDYLANIGPTHEQRREAGVIDSMDARADATMAADLEEANAVRGARDRGFSGSHPLQEEAQWGADMKLRQLLIPKQMELQAKQLENQTGREFNASQHELDRTSRERIASGSQAAGLARVNTQQAGITARQQQAQEAKKSGLSKLYSWLTGSGGASAPAAQAPAAASGPVTLMDPNTGETREVAPELVDQYLARGAQIVR